MPTPQSGIVPDPKANALFLVLDVSDRKKNGRTVARGLAAVPALINEVQTLGEHGDLVCSLAVGPELWDVISPTKRPHQLRRFTAIEGPGGNAPSTGGDVLVHIVSARHDLNFELASRIRLLLGETVNVVDEIHGFRYLDSRDLTGFIDGTENPSGDQRAAVALIDDADSDFVAGSYVFTQRYVHDLNQWPQLPVSDQEQAIGRTKPDSVELEDKPPTSHVGRVVIEEDGEELQILRHSFPYGTTSEAGLFFIAYSKNPDIPHKMLERMIGTTGDGHHDHLLGYSKAVSGANFFAPSLEVLRSFE